MLYIMKVGEIKRGLFASTSRIKAFAKDFYLG